MSTSKTEAICGKTPEGFKQQIINDSNFIFDVDPNFTPLNLYNFRGNAVTVNSFSECIHYVEGGFNTSTVTIFDVGIGLLISSIGFYSIYKFLKLKLHKKIFQTFKNTIWYNKKEKILKFMGYLIFPMLVVQNYFLFDYVRSKSARIPRFIDEYISLASNVGFFKNFDFNAGEFIGGSYSVLLTSGPISAIGGVIGWNISSKLVIARISNFYWVFFLQLLLSYLVVKAYKSDFKFLIFINGFLLILIPWWQGSLYMIGEIASVIVFTNAIFLFFKFRNLSILLISISIFYGKLLTLLPFFFFYIIMKFQERKIKNIIKDFLFFLSPFLLWLFLVGIKYKNGNIVDYVTNLISLILGHQSVGIEQSSIVSEVANWNTYELVRILIVPLLFIYLVTRNRDKIDKVFGKISLPIVGSILGPYLWFWLLSPTKWMRYSQHFTIILIVSLIYFISFKISFTKMDLFILYSSLSIYIDNEKNLIWLFLIFVFSMIFLQQKYKPQSVIKFLFVLFIFIDISIPYFQKDTFGNVNEVINSCKEELVSSQCLEDYENQ